MRAVRGTDGDLQGRCIQHGGEGNSCTVWEEQLIEWMLFHTGFIRIIYKLLTDVRKGWKPKESPFAKETIPGQASCLVAGSELT